MASRWRLVAAGLVVIGAAGCAPVHGTPAGNTHPAHAVQAATVRPAATAAPPARRARPARAGAAAFSRWWAGGGFRHYDRVAMDLKQLIVVDALDDHDAAFTADTRRLAADAAAAGASLPPVGAAEYRAAMRDFGHAGADALAGSYARAYLAVQAGLGRLGSFTAAAGLTAASVPSS